MAAPEVVEPWLAGNDEPVTPRRLDLAMRRMPERLTLDWLVVLSFLGAILVTAAVLLTARAFGPEEPQCVNAPDLGVYCP